MTVRAALLDLDGTLIDTASELAAAINAMRADLGRPALPQHQIAGYLGKGSDVLVMRSLVEEGGEVVETALFEQALRGFKAHYRALNGRHAQPYPGVQEGLEAMRSLGWKLACVTNKPEEFVAPLLQATGLLSYFSCLVGGDTTSAKKPDPLPLHHACAQMDLDPLQAVMVGDSINDLLAGRAAGCKVVLVSYGYDEGVPVQDLKADAIVDSLTKVTSSISLIS